VRGIGDGTLGLERFKFWLRQDYVFLIEYARLLALAAARSPQNAPDPGRWRRPERVKEPIWCRYLWCEHLRTVARADFDYRRASLLADNLFGNRLEKIIAGGVQSWTPDSNPIIPRDHKKKARRWPSSQAELPDKLSFRFWNQFKITTRFPLIPKLFRPNGVPVFSHLPDFIIALNNHAIHTRHCDPNFSAYSEPSFPLLHGCIPNSFRNS